MSKVIGLAVQLYPHGIQVCTAGLGLLCGTAIQTAAEECEDGILSVLYLAASPPCFVCIHHELIH